MPPARLIKPLGCGGLTIDQSRVEVTPKSRYLDDWVRVAATLPTRTPTEALGVRPEQDQPSRATTQQRQLPIGAPYFTEDYQSDTRFLHRGYIDEAVAGEQIRAILGVPLVLEGRVIGALLAVHRRVRPFPSAEVAC